MAHVVKKIILVHGKYFNSWESLGLGYIASYIKKHLPHAELSFYQGIFDSDDVIISDSMDADLVMFSCTTPSYDYCLSLARRIKQENGKVNIVMGGYHTSSLPHASLVNGVIDQVIVGEGEAAVVKIINGCREPVVFGRRMHFNELPWPDRRLIRNERNILVAYSDTGKRITSFQNNRGCPFKCKFCLDGHKKNMYFGDRGKIISRDIDDLLDEILFVTNRYNLDLIKFCDATWNINKNYVKDFCRRKIERNIPVPFYPNLHANIVDEEMMHLMKLAGCYEVAIGVESGSQRVLDKIGKKTNLNRIRRAVSLAKKFDIFTRGYFIIGMPNEREEDIRMTELFAEELDLDEYGFNIICPFPGTYYYDSKKFCNIDWSKSDEPSNDFWCTEFLTNAELKIWQQRLNKKFENRITWHNQKTLVD